jgi:uncharacterized protein (TIGR03118 family)
MVKRLRSPRALAVVVAAASGLALAVPTVAFANSGHGSGAHSASDRGDDHGNGGGHKAPAPQNMKIHQVNLVSDIPGTAQITDPDLKNPWGMSASPTSPIWVSNQGTDASDLYSFNATTDQASKVATTHVPLPDSVAGPAGQVHYDGTGFVVSKGTASGPSQFIFGTLDGEIAGWNSTVNGDMGAATTEATVPGAIFSGLAEASTPKGDQLYAADFSSGKVDVFDSSFKQVKLASNQFNDPRLPHGYHAFNVQTLNGDVFVTYDIPNAQGLEGTTPANGVVDEYTPEGKLVARIATGGELNAPWGLAIAPASWGDEAGALLIGNFGDGRINIVPKRGNGFADRVTGQLVDRNTGKPFAEPGLWALTPGTANTGGVNNVWFAAGTNDEADGLLGLVTLG